MKDKNEKSEFLGLGDKLTAEHLTSNNKKWHKRLFVAIGVVAVLALISFLFFGVGSAAKYEFVTASVKDLKEAVEITGNVEAGATLALTFRQTGQVEKINYEVGADLKKGDVIASLKNRDQQLRLDQARANLAGAEANLNAQLAGSTNEEVLIAEAGVKQAEAGAEKIAIDWDNAKRDLDLIKKKYAQDEVRAQLAVDDAKAKYDYALKNQENSGLTNENAIETAKKDLEAQLYSTGSQIQQSLINMKSIIVNDGNSVLGGDFNRLDYRLLATAQNEYYAVKSEFDPLYIELKSKTGYESAELEAYAQTEQRLVSSLLNAQKALTDALSIMPPSSSLTATQISQLKSTILADSNTISASLAALNLKYQSILNAELGVVTTGDTRDSEVTAAQNYYDQQVQAQEQNKIDHQVDLGTREANIRSLQAQYQIQQAGIDSAKATLQQRKVGPRAVDVAFLRTQITANRIAVALAEEDFEKTLLRAPIAGVLSRKNIEIGEDAFASTGTTVNGSATGVFEMISDQKYKINADIAEVDINKLSVGDKASVTLDAVGEVTVFDGTITKIDPVETVVQDVVFYKAEVVIDSEDERIRPGMTATVEIILKEALSAVTVPEKAVQTDNGRTYVRQLVDNKVKEIDVETGIRDLQGNMEIKTGLSVGQEIILRTINGRG